MASNHATDRSAPAAPIGTPSGEEPTDEFIARRRADRDARLRASEDRGMMYRHLERENERLRRGPDRGTIESWLAETLIESDEFTSYTLDGDILDPQAFPLFSVQDAARIISRSLHPIGGFNGGGSLCVFLDPEGFTWEDLTKSGYRRLTEQAEFQRDFAAGVVERDDTGDYYCSRCKAHFATQADVVGHPCGASEDRPRG